MKRTLSSALLALAASTMLASNALAVPPLNVRGIDFNVVVGTSDRARLANNTLNGLSNAELKSIKTIVIDAGHGGENQGAIGVADIHEKYLTLELAYALRADIQERFPKARVVMTRYKDQFVGLKERIEYANSVDADLFISLHYNAATHDRAHGFETYFLKTEQALGTHNHSQAKVHNESLTILQTDLDRQTQHRDSARFAKAVNNGFKRHLSAKNRGVKQANFAVLRGASMPAVVVESGFVSHPDEGQKIVDSNHRKKLVKALVEAIESFDNQLAMREKK